MFSLFKSWVNTWMPELHPVRLFWHKTQAVLAAYYYGFPAYSMKVIGITGTNGKTSTAYFVHHILMKNGLKSGLLTTAEFKIGDVTTPNAYKQTTVSPWVLQSYLYRMKQAHCTHVVMEITSHAMVQSRTWGVPVDVAIFTNLTRDHYEYHGGEDAYRKAKGLLFSGLLRSARKTGQPKVSIINQDDPNAEYFSSFPADQMVPYGLQKGVYRAESIQSDAQGTSFTLKIPNAQALVHIPLPGEVNALNAVAAVCAALSVGLSFQAVVASLADLPQVPGRFERVMAGQAFSVVVDYAHSEDSLDKVCRSFKGLTSGRLMVVFGACGGGRDKAKRPSMGAIVHRYADLIFLTNDDPYDEDPLEIARMVREGIPREEGEGFWQILDRREAMTAALRLAKEGDTVLICGKGAELFQVLKGRKIPHDDRVVAREILERPVQVTLSHHAS